LYDLYFVTMSSCDSYATVRRAVIHYYHFNPVHTLGKNAVERLGEIGLAIVARNNDGQVGHRTIT
jgi:hypothetical protein